MESDYQLEGLPEDKDKHSLSFKMLTNFPHDLESIKGYWRLFPQKGGRTLIAYVVSVQAPMGIIAIAGNDLATRAIRALLKIPGDVRAWMRRNQGRKLMKK